ncbi:hypothetical protein KH5_02310 [Urechidicola sp. KH5]
MKKITLFLLLNSLIGYSQSTINITTSGGLYVGEKWVNITTEADGGGTQIWGQGDETQCNAGGLINQDISIAPGTYYVNCYDQYADGWDGTLISVTAYGVVIGDNGGVSPDDGQDTDIDSSCEGTADELEASFMIVVPSPPSCMPPSSLTATVNSISEAEISWTAVGTETEWTYEYGPAGFTQGNGTIVQGTDNSVIIEGLTSEATYDIYVQSNCGGTDGDSIWLTISWTMPMAGDTFATATTLPFTISPEGTGCTTHNFSVDFTASGPGYTISGLPGQGTSIQGYDAFFNWTATTSALRYWGDGVGKPYIGIHDSSGTEIAYSTFNQAGLTLQGWAVGDELVIRIYDYGNTMINVEFCLEEYTPSAPIVPNYQEFFDDYIPIGWSEAIGAYGTPIGTSSTFINDDFVNDTSNPNGQSAGVNIWGALTDEYLISPEFNLSGATYYLNFDIGLVEYNNTSSATLGSDDYVALLVTQDNGANWIELTRWDATTPISNTGQSVQEIELSGYGSTVQFAYYASSGSLEDNEDNDFFIDNFQITTTSLSSADEVIEGFKLYPTIVEQNLNFSAFENVKYIAIYNLLGQEVLQTAPNISNSSINLSALNEGVYMVKVQVGNTEGTFKIIKK